MSDVCGWLHERLAALPLVTFPLGSEQLPPNGIYFFYERDELSRHSGADQRIVRIGTHRDGNFRTRIAEHFGPDLSAMDVRRPKPADRSIFRKHLGRALLNRARDPYLAVWNIDFTQRANRERFARERDARKEQVIEEEVTRLLREHFSFRPVRLEGQSLRMGEGGLERRLIGTVAQCGRCQPSVSWLGRHHPSKAISEGKLWLVHYLKADGLEEGHQKLLARALRETRVG